MRFTRRQSLSLLGIGIGRAAETPLLDKWRQIETETDGVIGAAVLHLRSGRRISLRGRDRFPLASVCKLPIAIHILAMVSEGKCSLDDSIEIPIQDVVPGVSEVAERWSAQKRFPLNELLELMIAKSDNSVVQTLFRIGGGAAGLAARFRQWHIAGMRVDRSERECALVAAGVENIPLVSEWTPQMYQELTAKIPPEARMAAFRRFLADPRDTGTPDATVQLLQRAFRGELVPKALTARLVSILEATTTGSARIKGLLPGVVVAHKTGTTGTVLNLTGATNDVGVINLPEARGQIAIAVYVRESTRDQAARDRVIARFAKAAFDSAAQLA